MNLNAFLSANFRAVASARTLNPMIIRIGSHRQIDIRFIETTHAFTNNFHRHFALDNFSKTSDSASTEP